MYYDKRCTTNKRSRFAMHFIISISVSIRVNYDKWHLIGWTQYFAPCVHHYTWFLDWPPLCCVTEHAFLYELHSGMQLIQEVLNKSLALIPGRMSLSLVPLSISFFLLENGLWSLFHCSDWRLHGCKEF